MRCSQSRGAPGQERRRGEMIDRRWNVAACASIAVFMVAVGHLAHHYVMVGGQYLRIVLP